MQEIPAKSVIRMMQGFVRVLAIDKQKKLWYHYASGVSTIVIKYLGGSYDAARYCKMV